MSTEECHYSSVVFFTFSGVLDSDFGGIDPVEVGDVAAVQEWKGDVDPTLSVIAVVETFPETQVPAAELPVTKIGPDAVDGNGMGVPDLGVWRWPGRGMSESDLFLESVGL